MTGKWAMKLGKANVSRAFGMAVILLGPLAFVGTVLMAIAVVHDLIYFAGELPTALGLSAPAAYLVVRWVVPAVKARLLAAWEATPMSEAAD
jgi:hypothetical protein